MLFFDDFYFLLFSDSLRYFLLLCFSFYKLLICKTVSIFPFVFYEKVLYLCIAK